MKKFGDDIFIDTLYLFTLTSTSLQTGRTVMPTQENCIEHTDSVSLYLIVRFPIVSLLYPNAASITYNSY